LLLRDLFRAEGGASSGIGMDLFMDFADRFGDWVFIDDNRYFSNNKKRKE
jgi:hypothetical protein